MSNVAFGNDQYCYQISSGTISEMYRTKLTGLYWTPVYLFNGIPGFSIVFKTVDDFGNYVATKIGDYTHPSYRN